MGGHHAEFAGFNEVGKVFDLLGEGGFIFVLCGVRVGWLAASVSVGVGHFGSSLVLLKLMGMSK